MTETQPTREDKINKIKSVVRTTIIGIPGHSVCFHEFCMIGNVLDWIYKIMGDDCVNADWEIDLGDKGRRRFTMTTADQNTLYLNAQWSNKREPIDSQDDDCIDYVYSLIESLPSTT